MDVVNGLAKVVLAERPQVEVDPVSEIEVGATALHYQIDQVYIQQVLFNHHVGNHLGHEILQIIPVSSSSRLNYWVYSLALKKAIDMLWGFMLLIELG